MTSNHAADRQHTGMWCYSLCACPPLCTSEVAGAVAPHKEEPVRRVMFTPTPQSTVMVMVKAKVKHGQHLAAACMRVFGLA